MQISQEYRLMSDGSSAFKLTTVRGVPNSAGQEAPHVVIANGWVSGTPLYRQLARRMVAAAHGNLAVTTYEDPLVGSSAYGPSYKAERLTQSVRAVGSQQPVTVMGHSRGWLTTVLAGEQLIKEQYVDGLAGYTPMGLGEMHDFDLFRTIRNIGSEILRSPGACAELGSIATVGRLTGRALLHVGTNPAQSYNDIRTIVCADASEQTATLSAAVPTVMISGEYDTVITPDCLQRRLDAVGYQGSHVSVPVSHVGAVVDFDAVPQVYQALQAQQSS